MSNDFFVKVRRTIGFDGLISTIVGALIVFLPGRSARAAAGMVGAVFIAVGLFRLLSVFQKNTDNNWTRVGHVILSIIYLVAGVFIFMDMSVAAISLILVVGTLTAMTWLIEGIIQFALLNQLSANKVWSFFSALISVLGGLSLLFSPLMGGLLLWTFFGLLLMVIGIFKLIQFVTLKN